MVAFTYAVDMELPSSEAFPCLVSAVRGGKLSEQELDAEVARVLSAKFYAGLFEDPFVDENGAASEAGNKERAQLARQVADEALVLLKNDGNAVPLDSAKVETRAVIGPDGNKMRIGIDVLRLTFEEE